MRIRSRWFLGAALFLCPFGTLIAANSTQIPPSNASRKHPNVIIILVDALRADHLGCYGAPDNPTPVIDDFARSGVLFERCAAAAPWTKPSVTSIFTGLYVETHHIQHALMKGKVIEQTEVLPLSAKTLAESFQKAGYRTISIMSNPWIQPASGLGQGFEQYNEVDRLKLMDIAANWIRTSTDTAPFFLYIHDTEVHGHYMFDKKDFDRIRERLDKRDDRPLTPEELGSLQWYMTVTFAGHPDLTKDLLNWRAAYAAGVQRYDGRMPLLLDAIRDRGLLDNTIVIFTSDHGEGLWQHGILEHGKTLHIEEIQVPLIVRLPGGQDAGRRVPGWVSLVDIFPTLVDLCHLSRTGLRLQGISLAPALSSARVPDRVMFTGAMMMNDSQKSAIRGDLHLITQSEPPLPPSLYDIRTDPGERENIAGRRPKDALALSKAIDAHLRAQGMGSNVHQTPITDETREQLRSLGYTQ